MVRRALPEEGLLLDGAMGTTLQGLGLPEGVLPERWVLERPDLVTRVHREHVAAGARAVLTCSMNAHPLCLRESGLHSYCAEIRRLSVACARGSGAGWVLGVVGPLPPHMAPARVQAECEAAAWDLVRAGVDALVAETVVNLEEGQARVRGMATLGVPVIATVVPGMPAAASGELAVRSLERAGASVVGVNCATPDACAPVVAAMQRAGAARIWAKPSAGLPGAILDPTALAEGLVKLVGLGASMVGGCCGVSPAHLAVAARELAKVGLRGEA
jgi:5-methyltetrahydrofolate--homocysteine methyltransferase